MSTFKEKYIKYKKKYIELKNKMKGGSDADLKKALEESKRMERERIARERKEREQYDRTIAQSIQEQEVQEERDRKEQEQLDRVVAKSMQEQEAREQEAQERRTRERKIQERKIQERRTREQEAQERTARQISADRKIIKENIVGLGMPFCTGFKITPKIIFTASHCCGDLKLDGLRLSNCNMVSQDFTYDKSIVKYINQYIKKYPIKEYLSYNTLGGHLDFIILENKNVRNNDMIVQFLPHDAKMAEYEFEWVSKQRNNIKFIPFTFKDKDAFKDYTYQSLSKDIKSSNIINTGNSGSPVFAINKTTGKYFFMGVLSGSAVGQSKDGVIIDVHKLNEVKININEILKPTLGPHSDYKTPNKFGITNATSEKARNHIALNIDDAITKTNVYKNLLKQRLINYLGRNVFTGGRNVNNHKNKYLKYKKKYLLLKSKLK